MAPRTGCPHFSQASHQIRRMEDHHKMPLMGNRKPMVDYGRAQRKSLLFILVLGVAALLLIVLFCSSLFLTR